MIRRPSPSLPRAASLLLLPLLLLLVTASGATAQTEPSADIVERNVSFTVQNTNNTEIDCEADGQTYQIRGVLVGPAAAIESPRAVTLFLHSLGYGEFFGNFEQVPDYDFADKQARAGNVTVVVDRLGYGESDKPVGGAICFGSHADIAHQMIDQLRSGDYVVEGAESPAFSEVVLAGHSVGSIITEATAYTFGNMDAIMVLSYSDEEVSQPVQMALQESISLCNNPSEQAQDGPGGYVFLGQTQESVNAHFFVENADPEVVDITSDIRNRNPCGDILSYAAAVETNLANIGQIDVPVLVLIGTEDAIYPIRAENQAELFTGTSDVTAVNLAATGHALTLHRSADEFQAQVAQWLTAEGFGGSGVAAPSGGVDAGGGSTDGLEASWLLALGGVALTGAVGIVLLSRRRQTYGR